MSLLGPGNEGEAVSVGDDGGAAVIDTGPGVGETIIRVLTLNQIRTFNNR